MKLNAFCSIKSIVCSPSFWLPEAFGIKDGSPAAFWCVTDSLGTPALLLSSSERFASAWAGSCLRLGSRMLDEASNDLSSILSPWTDTSPTSTMSIYSWISTAPVCYIILFVLWSPLTPPCRSDLWLWESWSSRKPKLKSLWIDWSSMEIIPIFPGVLKVLLEILSSKMFPKFLAA